MNQADALDIVQSALWTVIVASGPAIGAAMAIGIVIALLQALTQVQEMTLTFIPKIIAILVICLADGPVHGGGHLFLRGAGVRPDRGRILGPQIARGTRGSPRKLHRRYGQRAPARILGGNYGFIYGFKKYQAPRREQRAGRTSALRSVSSSS